MDKKLIKDLIRKGIPLKDIARQTGVKYSLIKQMAEAMARQPD